MQQAKQQAPTLDQLESAPHYALSLRFEKSWYQVHGNTNRIHGKAQKLQKTIDDIVHKCDKSAKTVHSFTTELARMDPLNDQLAMYPGQVCYGAVYPAPLLLT